MGPANRLGLDYTAEAARLGARPYPIIDVHSHINGEHAAKIYFDAAKAYGIGLTYSMSRYEDADVLKQILGDRIRFIAVPDYWSEENRKHNMGPGYVKRIAEWHAVGARIAKLWCAPRSIDYAIEMGDPDFMKIDAPHRIDALHQATELGMYMMVHIADPDTWFKAKYTDAAKYGTKAQQYEPLEKLLDQFTQPWIGAHMGGWPEDLEFLTGLLNRHENLYLDTSATKWMVRELSKHSRADLLAFLNNFRGRILFGSDIVSSEEHLTPSEDDNEMTAKAHSPEGAFDLYASRYYALRTMFETEHEGESPIADPDLAMVDPDQFGDMDAPALRGKSLPNDILKSVYRDAARELLDPLHT